MVCFVVCVYANIPFFPFLLEDAAEAESGGSSAAILGVCMHVCGGIDVNLTCSLKRKRGNHISLDFGECSVEHKSGSLSLGRQTTACPGKLPK